jgi:hypothetical protein
MKFEASKMTIFKVDETSMTRKVTKVSKEATTIIIYSRDIKILTKAIKVLTKAIKTKLIEDLELWIPDFRHWSAFSYIFMLRWHE